MKKSRTIIYLITTLSGAAGLIYEITWTRMLVLVFGNSTHSITAVISAFLGGLAIGSFVIGNWSAKKTSKQILKTYALIEFGIGIFAASTLFLLPLINRIYFFFSDGASLTIQLMIVKILLTTLVLLPSTILMGGTLPLLVSLLKHSFPKIDKNTSLLYSLNTFGAVLGVAIASFICIELLGLRGTIITGVVINFIAGGLSFLVNEEDLNQEKETPAARDGSFSFSRKEKIILAALFLSGLISIVYEILWTRVLTPTTGTLIYSFAFILIIYLVGIAVGSMVYHKISNRLKNGGLIFATSQLGVGLFALCSVFFISIYSSPYLLLTLAVILPGTICMGLSFPAAVALFKDKIYQGKLVGTIYFANTVGCIIGGFLTSFFLISFIGSTQSIILFALVNFLLALILVFLEIKQVSNKFLLPAVVLLIFTTVWLFIFKRNDFVDSFTKKLSALSVQNQMSYIHCEDDTASVFGFQGKREYMSGLYVDGVEITLKVLDTRLMAHLPIALHPNPKSMLVIGLGMGSTYHSALLHKINVDAVELSPSVASMFSLFYSDADNLLKETKGKIIVNDGRNYVNLTRKKYDIVTIDPPPPFNAAGTTVLYSEDFYKNMLRILNTGALVMQWVPIPSREGDVKMVIKSFLNVFPYVITIKSQGVENSLFMFGSLSPIVVDKERINKIFVSKMVIDDIRNFNQEINARTILPLITKRDELVELTKDVPPITDNHPRTEYFLLRSLFTNHGQ